MGNLELLESLKKTPDQKGSSAGISDTGEETCGSSTPEGSRMDLKEDGISDNSDKLVELAPHLLLNSQGKLPPQEERNDVLRSLGQTSDVKDHGSLSKMTTKNGLMMQVSMFSFFHSLMITPCIAFLSLFTLVYCFVFNISGV